MGVGEDREGAEEEDGVGAPGVVDELEVLGDVGGEAGGSGIFGDGAAEEAVDGGGA